MFFKLYCQSFHLMVISVQTKVQHHMCVCFGCVWECVSQFGGSSKWSVQQQGLNLFCSPTALWPESGLGRCSVRTLFHPSYSLWCHEDGSNENTKTPSLPPTCPGRLTATGLSMEWWLLQDSKCAWTDTYTHTHTEKNTQNSHTDGPSKRKCCLTPAPCGHGRDQIASKEVDASWLSYLLGKGKGLQSYLRPLKHYVALVGVKAVLFTNVRITQRTKQSNNKHNHRPQFLEMQLNMFVFHHLLYRPRRERKLKIPTSTTLKCQVKSVKYSACQSKHMARIQEKWLHIWIIHCLHDCKQYVIWMAGTVYQWSFIWNQACHF